MTDYPAKITVALNEMVLAQQKYLATHADDDLRIAREKEARFKWLCLHVKTLPLTEAEKEKRRLEILEFRREQDLKIEKLISGWEEKFSHKRKSRQESGMHVQSV